MVRGRLPRESNPVPGQSQPGFVPAFDETGNEDYVRVSNQKPYPVANYTQNPSGVWLPTSQNNPMPTQLTGSIVEKTIEITTGANRVYGENMRDDTSASRGDGFIPISAIGLLRKKVIVINNFDSELVFRVRYYPPGQHNSNSGYIHQSDNITVPVGATSVIYDSVLQELWSGIGIRIASNLEALGSGKIYFLGGKGL